MKLLKTYLHGYEKESILAPLFKLLEAFFDLLVPLVIAQIIDVGLKERNLPKIWGQIGILLLLAILGLAAAISAQYFAAKASVGFATKLRQATFDHIQGLSYTALDNTSQSTLITRLTSDINRVQDGLNLALRLLLRSPFVVFGSMIMAFTINVKAALIFVVAIPVLSLVVFGIMLVSIPLFKKVQFKLDRITQATTENLTGVRVIRAFRKEQAEVADFDQKNQDLTNLNLFVGRLSAAMNPLTYALINIATIVLIYQGAIQVNLGSMQQGQVVALYNYMAQMIIELIKLASLIITINQAIACGQRVDKVLAIPAQAAVTDYGTATKLADSSVEFDQVSFTYDQAGAPSLSNVSLTAKPGQTIGIIGGTGSGKSTLINLIPRFYDASQGQVKVGGRPVQDYAPGALVKAIGVVPQKAQLFAGSIRDNLQLGRAKASDDELWEALSVAQAKDVVAAKPGQLDFKLEQGGRNLSGGQKQRLTIVRALVTHPQILLLDDSASALDFATDANLRQAIHNLSGNLTTFIVSQRAASIMQADQILVLSDGQVAGLGSHEQLLATCPVYQEIFYSQFPEKRKPVQG